ncbi:MAG TPA: phenylalanine--tRNA ligase subunit beta, partial [Aeromicrobium sp.]|nr:phenylalanine--tRNA ligase subunit beta [Aeromicrobium sp.]
MRFPVEWLREYVDLPSTLTTAELADKLTMLDLKTEAIHSVGVELSGPLAVGRVLFFEAEEHSNGKTVRWCQVDVGEGEPRGIVCGADNFSGGDLVVVSLPGATLPGGFAIAARKTYGHVSDGMICSSAELGLSGDASGILVLDPKEANVGDDAVALLGLRADVLELEVNPDRGYALSMRGIARDAAIGFDASYTDPAAIEVETMGESYPVRVEEADACPVFVTRTITGFDPSRPTPRWLARRVELAGMRPISLAVDITNYVMLELGQPVHGYDRTKLQGPIVVRRATAGEKLTTLDDVERTLTESDLLIADDSGPIGLAGVMGGQTTELSATTTDIVVEAAHFLPAMIAHTARVTKLPSEASKRFERGVDPALPVQAAHRVATMLVDYGGGAIDGGVTVVGEMPMRDAIALPRDLPSRVTGIDIDDQRTASALEANGCRVEVRGDSLYVIPPSWRPDLVDPYDVVEEVLRVVGYDQVPSILPVAPAGTGLTRDQTLRRRVSRALAGDGLIEVKTFP